MKISYQNKRTRKFLLVPCFLAMLIAVVFFFMSSSVSFAPTKLISDSKLPQTTSAGIVKKGLMSDYELSDAIGQSFVTITQSTNTTTAHGSTNMISININADVDIESHVDSQKMGYYNRAINLPASAFNPGWDMNQANFYQGSTNGTTPFHMAGLFLELGFDNIANSSTRVLNYIDMGTKNATGTASSNPISMSVVSAANSTGANSGVMYRGTGAAKPTVNTFNNEPMSFLFAAKYTYGTDTTRVVGIFMHIPNQVGTGK